MGLPAQREVLLPALSWGQPNRRPTCSNRHSRRKRAGNNGPDGGYGRNGPDGNAIFGMSRRPVGTTRRPVGSLARRPVGSTLTGNDRDGSRPRTPI